MTSFYKGFSRMAQGTNVLSNDTNCIVQKIVLKDNQVLSTQVASGEVLTLAENTANVRNVAVNADGQLMITLSNGAMLIVKNYADFKNMDPQPVLQMPNGQRVAFADLAQGQFVVADGADTVVCETEPAAVTADAPAKEADAAPAMQQEQPVVQAAVNENTIKSSTPKIASVEPSAKQLADIEPAAGDAGGTGAGRTGFGFQSSYSGSDLQSLDDVGVIDPTALGYGAPDVQQNPNGFLDVGTPGLAFTDSNVSEDGSVQLNLQSFPVNPGDSITITVTGFLPGWGVDTTQSGGIFDAATGTWTITLAPGQSFTGGPLVSPPANSDGDSLNLNVTTTATNVVTGNTATSSGNVNVYTDAVADAPGITEQNASGMEDTPIPLNIGVALTDTDGSEEITNITISGVPAGASLNNGVEVSPGVWVLTMADLKDLTITPPLNYSGTFNLNVSATSTETTLSGNETNFSNNSATTTTVLAVNVTAVADAPHVKVDDMCVKEDGVVQMNIKAELADTDGSETLTIVISGIPADWGVEWPTDQYEVSYDAANNTWTIKLPEGVTSFEGGPLLKPPANSDADLKDIKVTAVATEPNGSTATTSAEAKVIVDAVVDAPTLKVESTEGNEDDSVALKIETAVGDNDGSEKIVEVIISGVPDGFQLSGGKYMGGGVWVLQEADLKDLKLIPPANWSGTLELKVTSVAAEVNLSGEECDLSDNTTSVSSSLTVTIHPQPDLPVLKVEDSCIKEDGAGALNIHAEPADPSESLTIVISGIPGNWGVDTSFSGGVYDSRAGTWTIQLRPGQSYTGGPVLKPPADSDADLNDLQVTVTSTDPQGNTATTTGSIDVIVDAVVDVPKVEAKDIKGHEDEPLEVNISAAVTDTDGSEEIQVILIKGLPDGFSMSAGEYIGNGIWALKPDQLSGLKLYPPANWSGDLQLSVTAVAAEVNLSGEECDFTDNKASATTTINLHVSPCADAPSLCVRDVCIKEDGSGQLNIDAAPGAADERLTVTITGIGADWGVNTSQSGGTYDAATGTWTITLAPGQSFSGGPVFSPPHNSDVDMNNLHVTATSTASNGSTASAASTANVYVDAVADVPNLTVSAANGEEGQPVGLNIATSVNDTDGSEVISSIQISGVPAGFTLSAGSNLGNGVWVLTPAQLAGLSLNPPAGWSGNLQLTVTSTATEANLNGNECDLSNNQASVCTTLSVTVTNTSDPPNLCVGDVCVKEDGSAQLSINASLNDPRESLTITISGIQPGWGVDTSQSGGTYNAATGTWTITLPVGQNFSGGPVFSPPHNSDIDMNNLQVTATSTTGSGSSSSTGASANIYVDAVIDPPYLNTPHAEGEEGQPIPLNISAGVTDTDGSEAITSVTIHNVPNGFTLVPGTNLGNGIWAINPAQLSQACLVPPANWSGNLCLSVSVTATEVGLNGVECDPTDNQMSICSSLNVCINPAPTPPNLCVGDVCVKEDGSAQLGIVATLNDPSERLTVTISGIQPGWGVDTSQSGGTYNAATGTWTITLAPGQNFSGGPMFNPPHNSDVDMTGLTVTATSSTSNGTGASVNAGANVYVDAVIDAPYLNTPNAYGNEDQPLPLNISAGVTDTDGSETITSATIHGVPSGFVLVPGTDLGNCVWAINPAQLSQACLVPPANWSGNLCLTVSVTATETNLSGNECDPTDNQMTVCSTLNVCVNPVPDMPSICACFSDICINEDGMGAVNIVASLRDTDGSERLTVSISGIQPGWDVNTSLSGGVFNANTGTWTITLPAGVTSFAGGPIFIPPHDTDVDLTGLVVRVTATESNGQSISRTGNMNIYVDAIADAPSLSASGDTGHASQPLDLTISTAVTDIDGSESITRITVSGVPSGVTLSAGTDLGGGVWQLTAAQLANLKVITPPTFSGSFTLEVSSTSTETNISGYEATTLNNSATSTTHVDFHVTCGPLAPVLNVETTSTTADVNVQTFEHVFSTDVVFPSVTEGQVFNHPEAMGINPTDLAVDRDVSAQVSWVSEGAGYNNSLGYYVVDAGGRITGVQFLFANASQNQPGATVPMAVDVAGPGSSLGFFIVADGFSLNGGYAGLDLSQGQLSFVYNLGQADERVATVNDAGSNISLVYTGLNGQTSVLSGPVYHTTDRGGSSAINPDGQVHVASGLADANDPNVLRISFEDLPNLGDRDFEDIVFDLRIMPSTERTIDPVTLSSVVDISDADSAAMGGATVSFASGYQAGDQLTLTGGYTLAGNGHVLLNGVDTGIVLSSDPANPAVLGFSGTASIEAYEGLLASVAFGSTSTDVMAGARVFDYTVTDTSGLTSNLDQVTVTIRDPGAALMAVQDNTSSYDVAVDDASFAALFTGVDYAVVADQSVYVLSSSKFDAAHEQKVISMASVLTAADPLAESFLHYANDDHAKAAAVKAKSADVQGLYATLVTDAVDLSLDHQLKNGNSVA
jgi:hypothetical protein